MHGACQALTEAGLFASRAARLEASPASANSAGVTSLTFLSVVCALRMTATSSWKVDAWSCERPGLSSARRSGSQEGGPPEQK